MKFDPSICEFCGGHVHLSDARYAELFEMRQHGICRDCWSHCERRGVRDLPAVARGEKSPGNSQMDGLILRRRYGRRGLKRNPLAKVDFAVLPTTTYDDGDAAPKRKND